MVEAGGDENADVVDEIIFSDPKKELAKIKSLYNQNVMTKADEARILTAIYTHDKPVVSLYRELLYRRLSQSALYKADSMLSR